MWESPVTLALCHHHAAPCEQEDAACPAEDKASVYAEHYAELTESEAIEYRPSAAAGNMVQAADGAEYEITPTAAEEPEVDRRATEACD
jgi:hypothetical protein